MQRSIGIPWWVKIGAKVVLRRIPVPHGWWRSVGIFRHGDMNAHDYAIGVVRRHLSRMTAEAGLVGKTVLELGPGDGVATAVIVAAYGGRSILVDTGGYADTDINKYRDLTRELRRRDLNPVDLDGARSINDVLDRCSSEYLTEGLESLRTIASSSVDFVFSQAVLEHVTAHQFLDTLHEMRRILRPGGMSSHRIDLRDHLGGGLNNLRFSTRIWESNFFARSGFYTNRIRFSEMNELFERAGFSVEIDSVDRWPSPPLPRHKMAPEFRGFLDDDLAVSGFDVVLQPV